LENVCLSPQAGHTGCMGKKRRILLAALLVAVLGGVAWLVLRPGETEPVYQGKPLSVWLRSFDMGTAKEEADVAADAVRHIGTNALPMLLEMIRSKDSKWESIVIEVNRRQSLVHLPLELGLARRMRAASAFHALGAEARPAVPALVEVLFNNPDNTEASLALVAIGPEAIPPLMQALTNGDPKIRTVAVITLGGMSFDADGVVPVLIKSLKDEDRSVRFSAALSLGEFPQKSAAIVPALTASLEDKDAKVRTSAIYALSCFGREAQMASSAIQKALNDPNNSVRRAAAKALKKIDPEAAAKAGVK
jgi:hypothetical protein